MRQRRTKEISQRGERRDVDPLPPVSKMVGGMPVSLPSLRWMVENEALVPRGSYPQARREERERSRFT